MDCFLKLIQRSHTTLKNWIIGHNCKTITRSLCLTHRVWCGIMFSILYCPSVSKSKDTKLGRSKYRRRMHSRTLYSALLLSRHSSKSCRYNTNPLYTAFQRHIYTKSIIQLRVFSSSQRVRDYYEILGVTRTASSKEIKLAYYKVRRI
jgi:hypothetical protein